MLGKSIAERLEQAAAIWHKLKLGWFREKFPDSPSRPEEFLACLLIAQFNLDETEVIKKVREGRSKLDMLKSRHHITSSEIVPVLCIEMLGLMKDGTSEGVSLVEPELKPVPPVTHCPHCNHNFATCVAGGYKKTGVLPTASSAAVPAPATPVLVTSGCCHVDNTGKCVSCTKEETADCSNCGESVVESKGHRCKNPDCEGIYCADCRESYLNERGYCGDCETIDCSESNCNNTVDSGTEHRCANPDCPDKEYAYCDECAEDMFNEKGLCPKCSGEDEYTCDECLHTVTVSKIVACKGEDCTNTYCKHCAKEAIDSQGRCSDCSIHE